MEQTKLVNKLSFCFQSFRNRQRWRKFKLSTFCSSNKNYKPSKILNESGTMILEGLNVGSPSQLSKKFRVSYGPVKTGLNGAGNCIFSTLSQLMSLNSGCFLISETLVVPETIK